MEKNEAQRRAAQGHIVSQKTIQTLGTGPQASDSALSLALLASRMELHPPNKYILSLLLSTLPCPGFLILA